MYGLVVVAAVASPGWPQEPPAWMGDALAFRMPADVARANWNLACKHPATVRDELYGWNTTAALGEWQQECDWRRAVWDKVDDVWFCRASPPSGSWPVSASSKSCWATRRSRPGGCPHPSPTTDGRRWISVRPPDNATADPYEGAGP